MMATVLGVIALILGICGTGTAVVAIVTGEPRFMMVALGYVEISLVFGIGQAGYQGNVVSLVLGGIGLAVIGGVMQRCWPPGWKPWRYLGEFRAQTRIRRPPNVTREP